MIATTEGRREGMGVVFLGLCAVVFGCVPVCFLLRPMGQVFFFFGGRGVGELGIPLPRRARLCGCVSHYDCPKCNCDYYAMKSVMTIASVN